MWLKGFLTLTAGLLVAKHFSPAVKLDQKPAQLQPSNKQQMEYDWSAALLEIDLDQKVRIKNQVGVTDVNSIANERKLRVYNGRHDPNSYGRLLALYALEKAPFQKRIAHLICLLALDDDA